MTPDGRGFSADHTFVGPMTLPQPDGSVIHTHGRLLPVDVKVWQPEGHQLTTGAGRVYNDYPTKEPIATNLFALWPHEGAYIRIKNWENIVQSLPANFIQWTCKLCGGDSDALTPDENKLRALVKWAQPTNEAYGADLYEKPGAYVIELKLGEEKHDIMFAVPDVGELPEERLPFWIRAEDAAEIALKSFEFQRKTQDRFGRGPKHDAIKHASWSAWITQLIGPEDGRTVTNAHEATGKRTGGLAFDSVMDLWNNAVGRETGAEAHELPANQKLTIDQWIDGMALAYDAGELVIWWPSTGESNQSEGILRKSDGKLFFGEDSNE